MIGRTIDEIYKIYDEVGSGGFSTVYLARNLRTNEVVAVKVMHARLADDPRQRERFRREAEAAQAVDSPYIVKVLDHGEVDGRPYLVMEYVDGNTLAEVIHERGPLPVDEAIRITRQVARALDAIHRVGMVHRDIKPQNIMVTRSGPVKLMDLGIVKSAYMGTITQTGTYVGTPHYMSPEQIRGREVDVRTDIYALGVVLYQMLIGQVPFDADSPWVVMRHHLETPPPLAPVRRRDLPQWLVDVLKRMLAKEPAQRFQAPADLLNVLILEAHEGEPPLPRGPRIPSDGRDRRIPRWAPFAGITAILLFGLGGLILANSDRQPTPTLTNTPAPEATPSFTLTPTRTLTPTVKVTPSPMASSTPTLTPTHTPTVTPSRTPTRRPTRTPTRTARPPTRTPTQTRRPPTSTPTVPPPTWTPTVVVAAKPVLDGPIPDEHVAGPDQVVLKWWWPSRNACDAVNQGVQFEVRTGVEPSKLGALTQTQNCQLALADTWVPDYALEHGFHAVHWQVAVIGPGGRQLNVSETRGFSW